MSEDRNITGNIGLFYVCYKLSQGNWAAMPTTRNAKGADIIAVKGNTVIGIQVKSLSNKGDVWLGNNYKDAFVHFWVVVTNCRTKEPIAYIIPSEDIKQGRDYENKPNNGLITWDSPKDGQGQPSTFYISHTFLKNSGKYKDWDILDSVPACTCR